MNTVHVIYKNGSVNHCNKLVPPAKAYSVLGGATCYLYDFSYCDEKMAFIRVVGPQDDNLFPRGASAYYCYNTRDGY